MPLRIVPTELAASLGSAFGDWINPVIPFVEDFACSLWEDYPDRITKNTSLRTSFQRGFMTSFCGARQPDPPTSTPGCEALVYVYGTFLSKNSSQGGCNVTAFFRNKFGIPESNVASLEPVVDNNIWVLIGADSTIYQLRIINEAAYNNRILGSQPSPVNINFRDAAAPCPYNSGTPAGDNFVRTDQIYSPSSDPSCSDQPQYPVSNPPPVISRTTTINYDSTTAINLTLNVETDDNGDIGFPIVFFNPEFSLTLDVGGITIDNSNQQPEGEGDVVVEQPPVDVTIKQPYIGDPNITVTEKTDEDPKDEEVGEDLRFVEVIINSIPTNAASQFGGDGPNVFYCGWFEFSTEGRYFPREPIHFSSNIFVAPDGATGYAYTLYQGFAGRANIYTIEEE